MWNLCTYVVDTNSNIWTGPWLLHLMSTLSIEADEDLLLCGRCSQCRNLPFTPIVPMFMQWIHCRKYVYFGCGVHRIPHASVFTVHFPYSMYYFVYSTMSFWYGSCIWSVCGREYGFLAATHYDIVSTSLPFAQLCDLNTYWPCGHVTCKTMRAYNCFVGNGEHKGPCINNKIYVNLQCLLLVAA